MLKLREKRGITLVALVITIIILLILASVTIVEISGNGLFDKVKQAREENKFAKAQEKVQLAVYASYGETGGLVDENLKENLESLEGFENLEGFSEEGIATYAIQVTVDGYKFSISDTGVVVADGRSTKTTGKTELQQNTATTPEGTEVALEEIEELKNKDEATATENEILEKYTAYSKGQLITGKMKNMSNNSNIIKLKNNQTYEINEEGKILAETDNLEGYYSGNLIDITEAYKASAEGKNWKEISSAQVWGSQTSFYLRAGIQGSDGNFSTGSSGNSSMDVQKEYLRVMVQQNSANIKIWALKPGHYIVVGVHNSDTPNFIDIVLTEENIFPYSLLDSNWCYSASAIAFE